MRIRHTRHKKGGERSGAVLTRGGLVPFRTRYNAATGQALEARCISCKWPRVKRRPALEGRSTVFQGVGTQYPGSPFRVDGCRFNISFLALMYSCPRRALMVG